MGRPVGHIRILMSSRVLLDLEEADRLYKEKGLDEYVSYMRAEGAYKDAYDPDVAGRRLKKGPLWSFAKAALKLNEKTGEPVVEIGVLCKDVADSALPLFRNLDLIGLKDAEFRIALAGHKTHPSDLKAFEADMFLSRNPKDVQMAVDNGIAAATINFPPSVEGYEDAGYPVRIWVDGDAVAFGSSSEYRFKTNGLKEAIELEGEEYEIPIEAGPFTKVLSKISHLNNRFERGRQPFEISLLTSRGGYNAARVFSTISDLGIHFNGKMFFMGGMSKLAPLKAHKPDLYLDDQVHHLNPALEHCPTGHVPYKTGSQMHEYARKLREQEQGKRQSQAGQSDAFNKTAAPEQDNRKPDNEGPQKNKPQNDKSGNPGQGADGPQKPDGADDNKPGRDQGTGTGGPGPKPPRH